MPPLMMIRALPYTPYDGATTYAYNQWYQVVMVYEADTAVAILCKRCVGWDAFPTRAYGSISNDLPTVIGASLADNGVEGTRQTVL